nr:tetratricopeptide repeat protein [Nocardia bovistercoris]
MIGVGTYDHNDRLPHIPAAANNLADLHSLLTSSSGTLDTVNCRTVADPSSSSHIGEILEHAAEQAGDTLLVYYTGHGLLDRRGRLHLALTGTYPDLTNYTALPFATLRETILDSPAAIRILILDCCFSGRAFDALTDGPDAILGQADIAGTYTITSSARNETSYAPPGQRNTAFTAALLAAGTDTPGLILDDLYTHTQQRLHRHGYPRPQRRAVDTAGQTILFNRPSPTPPAGEKAEQIPTARTIVFGPDHPDTLTANHELGISCRLAGRFADAIDVFEATLATRQRVLGTEHPETLSTRSELGITYQLADRVSDAIDLLETTLATQQRVLGTEHPETLSTRSELGITYQLTGQVANSIDILEPTLATQQHLLGTEHPSTLYTTSSLGVAYRLADRVSDAIDLLETTFATQQRVLGTERLDTLFTGSNLGTAYMQAERYTDAIDLLQSTLAAQQRLVGPEHPEILFTSVSLGTSYRLANRDSDAIDILQSTLALQQRVLGTEHPDTLYTRSELGAAFHQAERYTNAIDILEPTLAAQQRVLGPHNPHTLSTRSSLRTAYTQAARTHGSI